MTQNSESQRSALTLLVTWIGTDHTHNAVAPNDFAIAADALYRCQHFHDSLSVSWHRAQPASCRIHLLRKDSLLGAENDARSTQVIRRQLNRYLVTGQYANIVHTHFPGNKAQHDMTVFELYPERCIGEVLDNLSLHFYQVFLRHPISR